MGGVVEVNTLKDTHPGLHGETVLSGGSFDTAAAFAQAQYVWKGNTLGGSASGSMTSHYLNPVVPQNYTNNGTTGDFSLHYERDLTPIDRLGLIVRHGITRYQIPNEQVQQAAGQRQDGDSFETMGIVSYQHVFSSNTLGSVRGMVRDNSDDLFSNPSSTPIIASLHNDFKEGYFNGSVSVHKGRHEWKVGVESDVLFLHENFSDSITDPTSIPRWYARRTSPSPEADLISSSPRYVQDLHSPGQLDGQCRSALGSLSTPRQPECRQPAAFGSSLLPVGGTRDPCVVRSRFPDAFVGEHPVVEFCTGGFSQPRRFALTC